MTKKTLRTIKTYAMPKQNRPLSGIFKDPESGYRVLLCSSYAVVLYTDITEADDEQILEIARTIDADCGNKELPAQKYFHDASVEDGDRVLKIPIRAIEDAAKEVKSTNGVSTRTKLYMQMGRLKPNLICKTFDICYNIDLLCDTAKCLDRTEVRVKFPDSPVMPIYLRGEYGCGLVYPIKPLNTDEKTIHDLDWEAE